MTRLGKTALLCVAIAFSQVSSAQASRTRDPAANARQHHQRDRVQQGMRSGELTRSETRRLGREQRDIRQLEHEYKADGNLTREERRDLHQEQNEASRNIYQQKHDAQDRSAAPPAVRDSGVNARQVNQAGRVHSGVQSGTLTQGEAKELRTERRDIRELEQTYKADGQLTNEERVDLHQQLNQQSREIYEEKHDEDRRE